MFVDLYFPPYLALDRDQIQEAIETALGRDIEVVGAGIGGTGSNLDLELAENVDPAAVLWRIERTLTRLGVPDGTSIYVSDPRERLSLGELRLRFKAGPSPDRTE